MRLRQVGLEPQRRLQFVERSRSVSGLPQRDPQPATCQREFQVQRQCVAVSQSRFLGPALGQESIAQVEVGIRVSRLVTNGVAQERLSLLGAV